MQSMNNEQVRWRCYDIEYWVDEMIDYDTCNCAQPIIEQYWCGIINNTLRVFTPTFMHSTIFSSIDII